LGPVSISDFCVQSYGVWNDERWPLVPIGRAF
jgi:hypothetical protein